MKNAILSALILLVIISAGCGGPAGGEESADTGGSAVYVVTSSSAAAAGGKSVTEELISDASAHDESTDSVWDSQNISVIRFSGSVEADSSRTAVSGKTLTVRKAGTYMISGTTDDFQIAIDIEDNGVVKLVFNGVNISCITGSPLFIKNADEAVIILADGTENSIADGDGASFSADSDEPDAAVFSRENLTICGEGALTVSGRNNDGITVKDGLVVSCGRLVVTAVDDGIRGKDYLIVRKGNVSVISGGDGMKSDNDSDSTMGYVLIENGSISVTAGGDGISAYTDVLIADGSISIASGGGSNKAISSDFSAKGIKSGSGCIIDGGLIVLDSADDAIHSDGNIVINNTDIKIATGDDGLHADLDLSINDGKINITKSYEGLEAQNMYLNGGSVFLAASDDGINGAGGNDLSGFGFMPACQGGQDDFFMGGQPPMSSGNATLTVTGGKYQIDARGDGIDINGSVTMSGGTVIVSGPEENMNGAIDYDGTFNISGGFLLAAGSSGMAQCPGTSSVQCSALIYLKSALSANTPVHLQKSDGTGIFTFCPARKYQTIAFSAPELIKGSSYDVYYSGSCSGSAENGFYSDGAYTPGVKYTSFSVSNAVTTVGR